MSAAIETVASTLGLHRAGREWRGRCPACGYATSFTLSRGRDGRPLGWCASCQDNSAVAAALRAAGAGDVPEWHSDRTADTDAAKAARNAAKQARALALWSSSTPAASSIADTYLAGRGLPGLAASPAMRFRADCWHLSGGTLPAMIAAVTGPGGELVAVHRTYLAANGAGKANVEPAKASLGPIMGGAIRLSPFGDRADSADTNEIVIGEGIESAASAGRLLGLPAWSAISAGNLAAGLVLPAEVRRVIIAADPDVAGMTAAANAAARWKAEGRAVRIATPDEYDVDFNDLLMRRLALECV